MQRSYILIIETDGIVNYHVFSNLDNLCTYVTSTYYYIPSDIDRMEAEAVMNLEKPSFSFRQYTTSGESSKVTITVRPAPFTQ